MAVLLRPDRTPSWQAADDDRPLLSPRTVTAALSSAVTFVIALVMLFLTPPYAVQSPGPTVDTIGELEEGTPLITVEGTDTYLVYTRWRSEEDFQAWQSSAAFGAGHAQAAGDRPAGPGAGSAPHGGQGPAATGATLWSFEVVQQAGRPS